MKTLKTIAVVALAGTIAGTSVTAFAQGASAPKGEGGKYAWNMGGKGGAYGKGGRRGAQRFMERFDANKDGVVFQAEIDEIAAQSFADTDTDNNGSISLDEARAEFADRSKDMQIRAFQRLDADGDGTVTADEFNAMTDRLFARLDRDDNGVLEKMRGKRGEGRGHGRRMGWKNQTESADEAGDDEDGRPMRGEGRRWQGGDDERHGQRYGKRGGKRHMAAMGGYGRPNPMRMLFDTFDTDNDGKITRAEFDEVRGQLFASADTNGSGSFTLEDFSNIWLTLNDKRIVRKFQRADKDGDLAISKEEHTDRVKNLVERMDRNGDGVITKADFKRGKKGRGLHGGRHGDRQRG